MGEPKVNRDGRPCPEWCETDHGTSRQCRAAERRAEHGRLTASTVQLQQWGSQPGPELAVFVHGDGEHGPMGAIWIERADDAAGLANIAERLTEMSPAKVREFAGHIRAAAALAWPEKEAEAE